MVKTKLELKKIDLYQVVEYRKISAPRGIWLALLLGFLLMIFVPIIWQLLYDRKQEKSVQILHLPVDMFLTPMRNILEKARVLDSLQNNLGTPVQQRTQSLRLLALQRHPNRHIQLDSAREEFRPWYKLDSLLRLREEEVESVEHEQVRDIARNLAQTMPNSPVERIRYGLNAIFSHTLFSRSYLRAWEKEMEESSRLAKTVRPWMQFSLYALFGDMGEKAVVGPCGWVFYRPGIEYLVRPWVTDERSRVVDFNDRALTDDPLGVITGFRDQLRNQGVELLVVVIPGKPSVYPDLLVPGLQIENGRKWGHSEYILDSLKSRGVATVNLFSALRAERAQDSLAGDSLYLRTDTHWRPRGARVAAQVTAEALRKYFPGLVQEGLREYILDTVSVERVGDVVEMTGLPHFQVRSAQLNFGTEKTFGWQVYEIQRDSAGNEVSRKLYQDDMRNSPILILGDSFSRIYQTDAPRSAGWISHLAAELGQPLASVVSDGGASTLVRQTLARRPALLRGRKVIIWAFVERDFRFGAEGWKHVDL